MNPAQVAAGLSHRQVQARIILTALPALVLVGLGAWFVLVKAERQPLEAAAAVVLAAKWLVVPAMALLAGVTFVEVWRFTHADDVSGSPETASPTLEIALRYNRNTLEQALLASAAWLGLAASWPELVSTGLPILGALFVAGRGIFWAGYQTANWARACGFAMTMAPTAILLVAEMLHLVELI